MRKVIFTQTPLSLTYELELPKENSFIRFGMGKIDNDDPVTFKILVAGRSEIFSHTLDSPGWHDAGIDMSAYKEKKLEITFTTDSQKGNIALWSNPLLYTLPKKKFNVIIVLEDALRADHMSMYGSSRETTPVKKRFAKKGVLFLNTFAQAPKTRPSCASIMTSLHPTATRVWKFSETLHDNYLTLAEILRYAGFQTAAFIQNPNGGPSVGLHQGFSHLYTAFSKTDYKSTIYDHRALEWIKNHKESNYFLYLYLTDPHAPYEPPEKFRGWYRQVAADKSEPVKKNEKYDPQWVTAPTKNTRRTLYDGEIRNNDFHFARFLTGLKKLNSIHHTLIIFISDHGERLGEHDNLGINKRWRHGSPNYIQVIKTPLIMVYPEKLPPNLVITQPVQNLDIVPTILDLLKINRENLILAGDSLLPLIHQKKPGYWNNRLIVSDETINRKKWEDSRELASLIYKDTHILSSSKLPLLRFNYVNDKNELNGEKVPGNLKVLYKTFIRDLKNTYFTIWQGITKKSAARIKYDPNTIKRLKSLGYIQ